METGTQNHEGIVGAAAAVEFLASLVAGPIRRVRLQTVFDALHDRATVLVEQLWRGLSEIQGVRVYGPLPTEPRTPTVSFSVSGVPSVAVCRRLAEAGVFASHGDFYATTAVRRLGVPGDRLVRVGCACYTTGEEIDRLLAVVRDVATNRSFLPA